MRIERLDIHQLRNLSDISLSPLKKVNVFSGQNGSGKTSLLEAVYLLALGRSFRTPRFANAVQHGSTQTTVYAALRSSDNNKGHSIGVQRGTDGPPLLRLDGKKARSLAELVALVPVQLINAASFQLLEGPPSQRRQFIDWGVFHVEHRFHVAWRRAKKSLKQRNSLLRRGKIDLDSLAVWDRELVSAATDVDLFRQQYIEESSTVFYPLLRSMNTSLGDVQLVYRRGWNRDTPLEDRLQAHRETDLRQGFTSVGPH
ncbi:MAG: DNA replication/repair protein RecF, partial [Pseudomonadales bacterium]